MVRTINWACYMLPLFKTFLRSNAPPAHTRQVPMICFRPDDVEGFRCPHLCSFSVLVLFWGSGTSSERRRLDSWVYGGFLAGSTRWRCLAFWRSPDGVESPFAQPGLSELKVPLEVRLAADRGEVQRSLCRLSGSSKRYSLQSAAWCLQELSCRGKQLFATAQAQQYGPKSAPVQD